MCSKESFFLGSGHHPFRILPLPPFHAETTLTGHQSGEAHEYARERVEDSSTKLQCCDYSQHALGKAGPLLNHTLIQQVDNLVTTMSLEKVPSGEPPRFLLLLPPSPEPLSTSALKTAYGHAFGDVLKEVASHSSDHHKAAVLEIALACPYLIDARNKSRASLYDKTQAILAGVYNLIVITAAQEEVNIEDADGVDVRVILVEWSPDREPQTLPSMPCGPIVDIRTLARSGRPWQYAFGVESEAGESMVRAFVAAKESVHDASRANSVTSAVPAPSNATNKRHHSVAVGGTWDHLHIGHKLLITMTIFAVDEREPSQERTAIIGITGDKLLAKKKHAELVESWMERQKAVATFFNAIIDFSQPASSGHRHVSIQDDPGPNGKSIDVNYPNDLVVKCTEIQDPFGPTITDEQISALVISAETRAGGKAVNDKRRELGWKELDVYEVNVLDAEGDNPSEHVREGFESKISSTAIREKLAGKMAGKQ